MERHLTDESLMPWGEHKGKPLAEVPAPYLLDLWTNKWLRDYKGLYSWVQTKLDRLRREAAKIEAAKGSADIDGGGAMETYDEYLRSYRGF